MRIILGIEINNREEDAKLGELASVKVARMTF